MPKLRHPSVHFQDIEICYILFVVLDQVSFWNKADCCTIVKHLYNFTNHTHQIVNEIYQVPSDQFTKQYHHYNHVD